MDSATEAASNAEMDASALATSNEGMDAAGISVGVVHVDIGVAQ